MNARVEETYSIQSHRIPLSLSLCKIEKTGEEEEHETVMADLCLLSPSSSCAPISLRSALPSQGRRAPIAFLTQKRGFAFLARERPQDIEPDKEPLDWSTRIKIAVGAARGLEYLHCKANPPVIYRDLKSANILLDENFYPKLSDFGLAKLGPVGDNTHVSTRVVGTFGYCAPEYAMSGKLTLKSDIYSFGVVLLELITGRKAIDLSRKAGEQNLVVWSRPFLNNPKNFIRLADPRLQGSFHVRALYQAIAITAMCLQETANLRPLIGDIVVALEYLASQSNKKSNRGLPRSPPSPSPSPSPLKHGNDSLSRDRDFRGFSSI